MKILIADQFSDLGGAQCALLDLLPAVLDKGHTCLLMIPGDGPLKSRAERLGVHCEDIVCGPFGCGSKSLGDVLRFGSQFPRMRAQLRRMVDDFRPDVLYVNGPRLAPAACSLGEPVLVQVHSYLKGYSAALTGRSIQHARARVVANCHFVLEPLVRYLERSVVDVVYNGVRDWGYAAAPVRTGRIGIIGRICPEKGQRVFIEAARMVSSTLCDARFVVYGGTQFGDASAEVYMAEVRELARGLPVEFAGWTDDIGEVLRSLDLLVVASMPLAEATTRVIPEAYSAGTIVLASDLPGIREILDDGKTGFLFSAGKAEALADRMMDVMTLPASTLAAIASKARRQYEERFSLEVYQRRMIGNLERVGKSALA